MYVQCTCTFVEGFRCRITELTHNSNQIGRRGPGGKIYMYIYIYIYINVYTCIDFGMCAILRILELVMMRLNDPNYGY